ncbi:hypothetical protein [Marinobacter salarius]|uniref:hypothetical protein n=1 Tax=Marinobacter salarius TaxID=1420917 RepID=UPI0032EEC0EF
MRAFSKFLAKPSSLRLAALAVTALIAWLTLSPWASSPQPLHFDQVDKLWHFLAFFTWGTLVAVSWSRPFWQLLVGGLVFGGGIELIQPFVGRDAELADLGADLAGSGVGIWAGTSIRSRNKRKHRTEK